MGRGVCTISWNRALGFLFGLPPARVLNSVPLGLEMFSGLAARHGSNGGVKELPGTSVVGQNFIQKIPGKPLPGPTPRGGVYK